MVAKFKLINFKGTFIWQKSDITIGHLLKKLSFWDSLSKYLQRLRQNEESL